jgi:rSAM/selenodomain-associated transferase 2
VGCAGCYRNHPARSERRRAPRGRCGVGGAAGAGHVATGANIAGNVPLRLAIVIPALDEEPALRLRLPGLVAAADLVVVSDGGSRDRTPDAAAVAGARLVSGPPGRGGQLNRGAAAAIDAGAEALLFLHADTDLPPGALDAVRGALSAGAPGGAFRIRFASPRPVFRLGSALVNARTVLTRLPLGDQAQFATTAAFERLGGYREWPILEDVDFARRLGRLGRLAVLPLAVSTSPRRFERRGIARTVATNWLIWALFAAGVSPQRLARLYRHVR